MISAGKVTANAAVEAVTQKPKPELESEPKPKPMPDQIPIAIQKVQQASHD